MDRAIHNATVKRTKLYRFPQSLKQIGGADRYVVPSVVAIGPYHHGLPHLQEMEEVKHAAASQFCGYAYAGVPVMEVYGKVLSVAGVARSCYTSSTPLMEKMTDAEFAEMMFLDGCFLLDLTTTGGQQLKAHTLSCWPTIAKDILLLENQIPWLVLEALTKNCNNLNGWTAMDIFSFCFVDQLLQVYFLDKKQEKKTACACLLHRSVPVAVPDQAEEKKPAAADSGDRREISSSSHGGDDPLDDSSPPPHLLGLLWLRMTRGMHPDKRRGKQTPNSLLRLSSSAVYLSQIGLKLTASTSGWFADVRVQKQPLLLGQLSLTPLFLNEVVARILVNVVALEVAQATSATDDDADGFVVSSYLSVLAMLMDREEDVQQLRERGVLCAHFSNAQTLDFFKCLAQHLRLGFNYFAVVHEIDTYIRQRPVRIAVHRFVYNNFKIIASVLSIASVLVGVFKALYSIKQS